MTAPMPTREEILAVVERMRAKAAAYSSARSGSTFQNLPAPARPQETAGDGRNGQSGNIASANVVAPEIELFHLPAESHAWGVSRIRHYRDKLEWSWPQIAAVYGGSPGHAQHVYNGDGRLSPHDVIALAERSVNHVAITEVCPVHGEAHVCACNGSDGRPVWLEPGHEVRRTKQPTRPRRKRERIDITNLPPGTKAAIKRLAQEARR